MEKILTLPAHWRYGFATAVLLFGVTALWVPISLRFHTIAATVYYNADLQNMFLPRSFMGTWTHVIGLTPLGYIMLLQCLKFLWLLLVSTSLYRTTDRYNAFMLSVVFACSSIVYVTNRMSGFVDIAVHFFVLCGCLLLMRHYSTASQKRLMLCSFPFFAALMTHELALFEIAIVLCWLRMRFEKVALWWCIPFVAFTAWYLWRTAHSAIYGSSVADYVQILLNDHLGFVGINALGIFCAGGVWWALYALAVKAMLPRLRLFIAVSIVLCVLPLFIAADTQRMAVIIWLPVFLLLTDEKNTRPDYYKWLPLLCAVQLIIPPGFNYAQMEIPFNCYSQKLFTQLPERRKGNLWLPVVLRIEDLCN